MQNHFESRGDEHEKRKNDSPVSDGYFMIAFMRVYSSALSEQQELSSVQDEIPFAYELVETISAEDVNLW